MTSTSKVRTSSFRKAHGLLDKFAEYAQTVASDLNGNGKVDLEGDRFGILWQRDAIISFLHAGGSRIVSKNSEGEPEFVLDNENTINLMDKLDSFMFEPRVAPEYAQLLQCISRHQRDGM